MAFVSFVSDMIVLGFGSRLVGNLLFRHAPANSQINTWQFDARSPGSAKRCEAKADEDTTAFDRRHQSVRVQHRCGMK